MGTRANAAPTLKCSRTWLVGRRDIRMTGTWRLPTLIAMTTLVQVDLRSENRFLTCWLEPRVRTGDRITLKNSAVSSRLWDVIRVGEPRAAGDIKRRWNFDYHR